MPIIENILKVFSKQKPLNVRPYPSLVLLEVTNACNLKCRMCFIYGEDVKKRRETGFMKKDVWQAAIDEMGSWGADLTLDLHGAGEPLLHPELFEIISLAKGKKNLSTGFLSNATLLTKEKAQAVIETGVDWIGFSVDGAQREVFEYYRKGALLAEVEENIEYLLSIRISQKPSVYINMVCHLEADIELFLNRWQGKVDTIMLSIKRLNDKKKNRPVSLEKPCHLLYQQLIMGWDGTTALCCEDFCCDYRTGKFPELSLFDIWHGNLFNNARLLHEKGNARKIDLCRYCDSVVFHEYDEKTYEHNGKRTVVQTELPTIRK